MHWCEQPPLSALQPPPACNGGVAATLSLVSCRHLASVPVLPQLGAREVVTAALVAPVCVGAGVLARPVSVVQQTLVDVQAVDGAAEPSPALR